MSYKKHSQHVVVNWNLQKKVLLHKVLLLEVVKVRTGKGFGVQFSLYRPTHNITLHDLPKPTSARASNKYLKVMILNEGVTLTKTENAIGV